MKRLAGKPATVMLGSQLSCASVRKRMVSSAKLRMLSASNAQGGVIHVFQQGGFKKLPVYGVEVDAGSGGYQHQQEGCKKAAEKRAAMRLPCRVPVIRHVLSSPAYCIFR